MLVTSDGVGAITWSPDGAKIAFTGDLGDTAYRGSQVYVVAASGGTPANVSNGPWHDTFERWSADGRSLIFRSDRDSRDGVYALDPSTGAASRITPLPTGASASEAPPPNSTGGCVPPDVRPTSGPLHACVSPDRSHVASVEQERLVITDGSTRGILATTAPDLVVAPSPPAWSRDGARVAFYANEGGVSSLYILDVESAESVALVPADVRGNFSPSLVWGSGDAYIYFSDGAFCRQGCTPGFLYRVRSDGSAQEKLSDLRVLTLYGFQP